MGRPPVGLRLVMSNYCALAVIQLVPGIDVRKVIGLYTCREHGRSFAGCDGWGLSTGTQAPTVTTGENFVMHATSKQRHDEPAAPSRGALAVRITGATATGAALTYLSIHLVQEAYAYDARLCADEASMCLTPYPVLAFPASFVIALVGLIVAYRLLGIRPGLMVIPPTLLLAPFPVHAALNTVGKSPAVVVGAIWTATVALTAWRPYRVLGLSASAALLLASLLILWS